MSLTDDRPDLKQKLGQILKNKNLSHTELGKEYALDFEIEKIPYDINQIFKKEISDGGYNHCVLEIGSGWGEFTLENARLHPTTFILALEKKKHRVVQCIKDQKKKNISNVRWMVLDVTWFFKNFFTANSFDKIIMNFPDPWPKTRHQKHRYMSKELLETLTLISKENAILEFATDYWPYMEETFYLFEKSSAWKNIHGSGVILSEVENRPKSFFEKLKASEGEHIYHLQMRKI